MKRCVLPVFCMLLLALISACGEQDQQPLEVKKPASKEREIFVPESVVGQWKSVKIALRDLENKTENVYRVDIGGSFQIPQTGMRVTVKNFMPSFSVDSERVTSVSNTANNPAVQIIVRDGEKEIHNGWVFKLYPERHQFIDSRYQFVLLDYQPMR